MFRSPTLALLMLGATLIVPTRAAEPVPPPREGIDYQLLTAPVPTMGTERIEVAEVFSYRCHFCAAFQPLVDDWKKTAPADVRFVERSCGLHKSIAIVANLKPPLRLLLHIKPYPACA